MEKDTKHYIYLTKLFLKGILLSALIWFAFCLIFNWTSGIKYSLVLVIFVISDYYSLHKRMQKENKTMKKEKSKN